VSESPDDELIRELLRRSAPPVTPPPFQALPTPHPTFQGASVLREIALVTVVLVVAVGAAGLFLRLRTTMEPLASPSTSAATRIANPSATISPRTAKPVVVSARPKAGTIVFEDAGSIWRYIGNGGSLEELGPAGGAHVSSDRRYFILSDGSVVDAKTGASWKGISGSVFAADVSPSGDLLAFVDSNLQLFLVDRGSSPRRLLPDLQVVNVHFAPDGRQLAVERAPVSGTVQSPPSTWRDVPSELWLVDLANAQGRLLYRPSAPNPGPTFRFDAWAPDSRYLAVWEIPTLGSGVLDGRALLVLAASGSERADLGPVLLSPAMSAWRAPHTLAYVSGSGRETWRDKTLRVWSPEAGVRDVTKAGEVGLAPSWRADGTLMFVRAPAGDYVPDDFFAGRGIGSRILVATDLSGGAPRIIARDSAYAEEGAVENATGSALLLVRRRLGTTSGHIELWLADARGQPQAALVRLSTEGFGYYGAFTTPRAMAWSE
jgi:hypothetical protein